MLCYVFTDADAWKTERIIAFLSDLTWIYKILPGTRYSWLKETRHLRGIFDQAVILATRHLHSLSKVY